MTTLTAVRPAPQAAPSRLLGLLLLGLSAQLLPWNAAQAAQVGRPAPALQQTAQGGAWLNTPTPAGYSLGALRGQVVIVNFWVFSCINCHNSLPTLQRWYGNYHAQGLEIIGVHTPEFDSDRPLASVVAALKDDGVTWPVLQDNALNNWHAWDNHYWPAFYLIDRRGTVRAVHNGEISSRYPRAIPGLEATIQALLAEK
jgi:thiol-disulfide isomerase/thioredoxin